MAPRRGPSLLSFLVVVCTVSGYTSMAAAAAYPPLEASFVKAVVIPAVRAAIDASSTPDTPRPLLAGMVRFAFHDCAGG